jgi:transcriptional regulator with XRE-family HTH domain
VHAATIPANVVKVPALARFRLQAALSQRELAQQSGVSHPTIARLERGTDAHPRTVRRLAEALGVKPADLMREPSEN